MIHTCPRGHLSASHDYCDVCGTINQDTFQRLLSAPVRPSAEELCPNCATPREGIDRYCPRCAYDFEIGQSLRRPPADQPVSTALIVLLNVDPDRSDGGGSQRPSANRSEHVFVADHGSLVIGRDGERDLQIPIRGDPCVSRRHGEIMKIGAGWGIRDLGSTNGTRLNGVALVGTEVKLLLPGDLIEMGCYSRLTVQESPGRWVKW